MSEQLLPPKPAFLRLPLLQPSNVRMMAWDGEVKRQPLKASSFARRAGLRYESAVKKFLKQELLGVKFGVWFSYDDGITHRKCQVDALYESGRVVTIIEIKHHHTSDCWWQLRKLYEPILRKYYRSGQDLNLLEICKHYDPAISFPEQIEQVFDLRGWCEVPSPYFGVFSWRR